jgi:hypothetical protein
MGKTLNRGMLNSGSIVYTGKPTMLTKTHGNDSHWKIKFVHCHDLGYTISVLIALNDSAKHYKKQDVYLQAFLKPLITLFDFIIL